MNLPDAVAAAESPRTLAELNHGLLALDAGQRVEWALRHLAGAHVVSSSFGAQAAAMLHLLTDASPGLPVILVDTGYLFPETHRFAEQLQARLALNLRVFRPRPELAWRHEDVNRLPGLGLAGLERYNRVHKVEPMQRALAELDARTWFAGLRRQQSGSRAGIDVLQLQAGRWKVHPIADWSDRDVGRYLQRHGLPYHPLWDQGYVSIGDTHSTRRLVPGLSEEETRFFGLKRECGLHEEWGEDSGRGARPTP